MPLGLARRSYDSSGPSSPPQSNGNDEQSDHMHGKASDRPSRGDHRRSASSGDATPRPRAALPRPGPFLGFPGFHLDYHRRSHHDSSIYTHTDDLPSTTPSGQHNTNVDILGSDPFLAPHQPQPQQTSRRLGFFSSNATHHGKTSSPSRALHLHVQERSHSHPRSETSIPNKETQTANMTSVGSSNTLNKSQTSPSKASSTRTYDAKLVTREMHRLGTLAGLGPALAPSLSSGASASTVTLALPTSPPNATHVPSTSHTITHGINALTGGIATDKDNPWATLHVHVLPLFNEEPLRIPIEDLNMLVRRHIQTVLAASPSKALASLENDAREFIAAGMVTLNAKLTGVSDELLVNRLVEVWSFFWDHILSYVEGVLLPFQTDPLLTSLHRTAKQHRTSSPTRQGAKIAPTLPSSLAAFSPTIDVRSVALCAFRDRVVLPLHGRLCSLLSPTMSKETLARLGQYRLPRLQQMLLVLTSERRVRPPSPTLSLRVPAVQPNAGEAAINDLLRLFSQAQHHAHSQVPHHVQRLPMSTNLTTRSITPSFVSAGIPRDRRGRIGGQGVKMMILSAGGWPVRMDAGRGRSPPVDDGNADVEDEADDEGGETPRIGAVEPRGRERMREVLSSLRTPVEHHHLASTGGWGLGAGNEEKQREDDDDDEETMNWDQAQAMVERMVDMKPTEVPETRRRLT